MTFALLIIYFFILGINVTIGILKYNILDMPLKVMFWMLFSCLISEIIASYVNFRLQTKAPVYHFFSVLELILIIYYLLVVSWGSVSREILIVVVVISGFLGFGNLILFQPLKTYNTNMLIVESVVISGMALYALFSIMKKDEILDLVNYPHFRIVISILILWTGTFFFWAFLSYLKKSNPDYYKLVTIGQSVLNILVYAVIGYAYFKYKRPVKLTT